MLNKIGLFDTAREFEEYLNHWISRYVLHNRESAAADQKAQFPLSAASVRVTDEQNHPGQFTVELRLGLHYRLSGRPISTEIVVPGPR